MGCHGNWPSPSQGKEPAGGAPAHWSRPLPSLCMHKFQHSGELGRLNFISYLTGRKVDVFFFTVFVAKPIHGAQPGPRRGARGDAGCGAYVDELGKGEASSSGSRCFSVSVGDSQHWEPISPTPKNQTSRGMSHQPSLTHQPSVHRFLSQHPRCINPAHLQSLARCSTSPKPLNGVHPRSHSPGGGRQVAHHPEPGRTKQASCATTLWRPATDSICLSCISMLCASHMSTTTRSRSPAAHRLMDVVVVNIDSTVSPLSFLFPLLPPSHHRYTVPSPTVPTTVPTTVLSTPRLLGSLLSFLFSMLHES